MMQRKQYVKGQEVRDSTALNDVKTGSGGT